MFEDGLCPVPVDAFGHLFNAFHLPGTAVGARDAGTEGQVSVGVSEDPVSGRRGAPCVEVSVPVQPQVGAASRSQLCGGHVFWRVSHKSNSD